MKGDPASRIGMRQLRYFIAIIEAGSLRKASALLHIAQPALSQQLAALEEEIDSRLLVRSAKGILPTQAGLAVYRHAKSILRLTEQTSMVAHQAEVGVAGRVCIGMPSSIAVTLASPLLAAMRQRYPEIIPELLENHTTLLPSDLFQERVDLSILTGHSARAPGLHEQPLFDEKLCCVQPAGAPRADEPMALAEIGAMELILLPARTLHRQHIDQLFDQAGLRLNVRMETGSMHTLLNVVFDGGAASIVPFTSIMPMHRRAGLVVRPLDPVAWRRALLAWSASAPPRDAVVCVRNLLPEVVAELIESGSWAGGSVRSVAGADTGHGGAGDISGADMP